MARQRVITSESTGPEEEGLNVALRPRRLCDMVGQRPVVEKLAETYSGQFRFGKCNVDNNPNTPDKFGIRAIPTLLFFNQGQLVDKITGAVGTAQIEDAIKRILSGAQPSAPFVVQ